MQVEHAEVQAGGLQVRGRPGLHLWASEMAQKVKTFAEFEPQNSHGEN